MDHHLEHQYSEEEIDCDLDDSFDGGGGSSVHEDGNHGRRPIQVLWVIAVHQEQVLHGIRSRAEDQADDRKVATGISYETGYHLGDLC